MRQWHQDLLIIWVLLLLDKQVFSRKIGNLLGAAAAAVAVAGATAMAMVAEVDAAAEWVVVDLNFKATSQGKTLGDSPTFKGHGLTN